MKPLNRRTWAIMVVVHNPDLQTRLPRITAEAVRLGLLPPAALRWYDDFPRLVALVDG